MKEKKIISIIIFPGSNCDRDLSVAIEKNLGIKPNLIWHQTRNIKKTDLIFLPGGFSYGDYLRAGAVARFSKIMNAIKLESTKGKAIIGICNGFQILVESGLLPGALITNKSTRFISKEIQLEVSNNESLFTKKYDNQEIITMPIAHKQGNYFADDLLLKELEDNNQIAFKYTNNPNGSCNDIAGIFNKQKNILGMMPHPERAAENILGSKDGVKIFESILSNI